LEGFPVDMRAEIDRLAALPHPPERWLAMGPGYQPIAWIESRAWYEWHWRRGRNPGESRSLSSVVRSAVIARDGHRCRLCGGAVEPTDVHIDHIHPVKHGGTDDLDNLQVAHSRCNLRKGAKLS